jgi:outer membrane receptor protein involved in Fe transport
MTVMLYVGVENLFDREYYENGFLAPGAVGRGGIRVRF